MFVQTARLRREGGASWSETSPPFYMRYERCVAAAVALRAARAAPRDPAEICYFSTFFRFFFFFFLNKNRSRSKSIQIVTFFLVLLLRDKGETSPLNASKKKS